jgi:hypothetical protein
MNDELITLFALYMAIGPADAVIAGELCDSLTAAGFATEAGALAAFCAGATTWESFRLDPAPPADAQPGHLWFDIADLTPMVLIQHPTMPSPARLRWLATRPVMSWQYEAFRRVVRTGQRMTEFPAAKDYLSHPCATDGSTGAAGDIFHDEAIAYGLWFGKSLCDQSGWKHARAILPPETFAAALPEGRLAWDPGEYPLSEFIRIAIGRQSLDRALPRDTTLADAGAQPTLDRMLFDEWERQPEIGCSTMLRAQQGRILMPSPRTAFVALANSAAPWLAKLGTAP